MNAMADWLALALIALGTGLNLFGLYCGVQAFAAAWQKYGDGELWPWIAKAASAARAIGRRVLIWRHRGGTGLTVSGAAQSGSSVHGYLTSRPGFPDPGTDERRFAQLQHAIEMAFDQMSDDRGRANRQNAEFERRIGEIAAQIESEAQRLEVLSKEIASGDVRLQLLGLMAIGMGTILTATPRIWNAVAAIATPR